MISPIIGRWYPLVCRLYWGCQWLRSWRMLIRFLLEVQISFIGGSNSYPKWCGSSWWIFQEISVYLVFYLIFPRWFFWWSSSILLIFSNGSFTSIFFSSNDWSKLYEVQPSMCSMGQCKGEHRDYTFNNWQGIVA